jgi:hypothetical protein
LRSRRRPLPRCLPWKGVVAVFAATTIMSIVLLMKLFPETPIGLTMTIGMGVIAHGRAMLALRGGDLLRRFGCVGTPTTLSSPPPRAES